MSNRKNASVKEAALKAKIDEQVAKLKRKKEDGRKQNGMPKNIEQFKAAGAEHRFKPGHPPTPGAGAKPNKPIVAALREVLQDNPDLLREMAEKALVSAIHDSRWFKEIRDMLDGRPPVSIVGADNGPININVAGARDRLLAGLTSGEGEETEHTADNPTS